MARRCDGRGGKGVVLTIWHVAETGSTNSDLLARAAAGTAREGDWLIAEAQTAGRGRSGRIWASPSGNLYASGLVKLRSGDPPAATLAIVAGLALHLTLDLYEARLKWPNDVMVAGAKLSGILLERSSDHVVVGVGVNIAQAPEIVGRATTSLVALGVAASPGALVERLAETFRRWLNTWRSRGEIIGWWLDRAHPLGTPLSAALPDGSRIDGHFAGLTDDCALRLELADGQVRVIHAGDVFLI